MPIDVLCGACDGAHDVLLTLCRERFSSQIEATTTDDVLGHRS